MTLLTLIANIALVGLLVYVITEFVPMPPKFKQAIYVIAIVFLVLYVLQAFGLMLNLGAVRIGR